MAGPDVKRVVQQCALLGCPFPSAVRMEIDDATSLGQPAVCIRHGVAHCVLQRHRSLISRRTAGDDEDGRSTPSGRLGKQAGHDRGTLGVGFCQHSTNEGTVILSQLGMQAGPCPECPGIGCRRIAAGVRRQTRQHGEPCDATEIGRRLDSGVREFPGDEERCYGEESHGETSDAVDHLLGLPCIGHHILRPRVLKNAVVTDGIVHEELGFTLAAGKQFAGCFQ